MPPSAVFGSDLAGIGGGDDVATGSIGAWSTWIGRATNVQSDAQEGGGGPGTTGGFDHLNTDRLTRYHTKRLAALGYTVTLAKHTA